LICVPYASIWLLTPSRDASFFAFLDIIIPFTSAIYFKVSLPHTSP
jgi:hypothetical protein